MAASFFVHCRCILVFHPLYQERVAVIKISHFTFVRWDKNYLISNSISSSKSESSISISSTAAAFGVAFFREGFSTIISS